MWNLHECVLAIEKLHESCASAHMTKVLHEMLIDYNLTNKGKNLFFFLHNFCTKTFFSLFFIAMCN